MKKIWWLFIGFLLVACQPETPEIKTTSLRDKVEDFVLEEDANLEDMMVYLGHFHQVQTNFNPSLNIRQSDKASLDLEVLKAVKDAMDAVVIENEDLIESFLVVDTTRDLSQDQLEEARKLIQSLKANFERHRLDIKEVLDSQEAYIDLLTEFYSLRLEYFKDSTNILNDYKETIDDETL